MKAFLTATLTLVSLNYINQETKNINKIYEELEFPKAKEEKAINKFSWSKTNLELDSRAKEIVQNISEEQETKSFLQF